MSIESCLRAVREAPVIAFDVETNGVDWRRDYVVGYVITISEADNWYVPVRHGGGGNLLDWHVDLENLPDDARLLPTHPFEVELKRALLVRASKGLLTVGHNIKFDMHFAANHGVDLGRNVECTQLNEAILNEHAPSFSLDACCKRYGVTAKKGDVLYAHMASSFGGEADRNQMSNFWKLSGDDPYAIEYALGDGVSTLALREAQLQEILRPDGRGETLEYIHRLESDLISTVFRMERRGIKVDIDRAERVEDQLRNRIDTLLYEFPKGFNPRSGAQVQKWLQDQGVTSFPQTEKGNVSIKQKWLLGIEQAKSIVDIRLAEDLISKFIKPLRERHYFAGRVHASLNQLKGDEYGTITGRFSSSDPNLQQVPKRNKVLGRMFRTCFVPDEGMEFAEGDYSQCEPRLFAHYTKSPKIMAGYLQEPFVDMHQVLSEEMKVERDPTAKRMNMGLLTGMKPKTFSGHMGWDLAKATSVWKWYNTEFFPELAWFHDTARRAYRGRGYVKTLLGRRCLLADERYDYQAVSRIIQGSNADIVKDKLRYFDRACEQFGDDRIQVLMTVHDSFEWQNMKDDKTKAFVADLVRELSDVQKPPYNLRVPFLLEVGSGDSWAVATYGEEKK